MQVLKGLLAGSMNVDKNLRTQMADTKEAIEYNLEQIALGEENERLEAEEKGTWGIVDGDDVNSMNAEKIANNKKEIKNLYVSIFEFLIKYLY